MSFSFIITLMIAVVLSILDESSSQFQPPGAMPFPGMPGGMFPMSMMSGQPGNPGLSMNVQLPPMGQRNLPVVVVPHHSQDNHRSSRRKRRHRRKPEPESSSSESSSNSDSEDSDFRRTSRKYKSKKRHQILTPVVSYVTKDGYVVYQKKIKKDKPNDWLDIGHKSKPSRSLGESHEVEDDLTVNDLKERLRNSGLR